MKTASDLLKSKPDQTVFTIAPTSSVFEAVQLMADKNIGALLVTEGTQVVGIISERDCARKVTLRSRSSRDTPVRDIMTPDVMYVRPEHTTVRAADASLDRAGVLVEPAVRIECRYAGDVVGLQRAIGDRAGPHRDRKHHG